MAIDAVGAILKQQKRPHVKIAVNPYSVGKVRINIDNNAMHVKSPLYAAPSKQPAPMRLFALSWLLWTHC